MSTETASLASPPQSSDGPHTNGVHKPGQENTPAAPSLEEVSKSAYVVRAEETVERIASRVASLAATWRGRTWGLVCRACEEVDDLWDEVQSIRHGNQR
jgi:hypothetical protein